MELIFLGVLIIFTVDYLQVRLPWLSLMMSGPQFSWPPQHYQVWGRLWSLITSWNRSQKQFPSFTRSLSRDETVNVIFFMTTLYTYYKLTTLNVI